MLRTLAMAAALASLSISSVALAATTTSYQLLLQTRQDAAAPNEVFIASFGSLDDVFSGNTMARTGFSQLGISPAFRVSGLTHDGSAYRMLLSTREDAASPNEVFVASFATLDDVFSGNTIARTGFSQLGISPSFRVSGLTYDGSAYRMVLSTRIDAAAPNEVFIASFATLDDLFSGNTVARTGVTQLGISPAFEVVDMTYDGAYRLMLQTRTDAAAPNEVFIASFATLDNLFSGNTVARTGFSQLGISPNFRIGGFASLTITDPPPPPPVGGVPEPESWALLIIGFVAVGTALRRRRLQAA